MATRITGTLAPDASAPTPAPAPASNATVTAQFTTIAPSPVQDTVHFSPAAQAATAQQTTTQQSIQPAQVPTTAQIVLMERLGQSVQQIATHFGISQQQVLSYLQTTSQSAPPVTPT